MNIVGNNQLEIQDQQRLDECEQVIERGLSTFVEVGSALKEIRGGRLYSATHSSFESYCRDRWAISKPYATQLISAAQTRAVIEAVAVATTLPTTESQARPLSAVPLEKRAALWQQAVDTAPRDELGTPIVTAGHVKRTVDACRKGRISDGTSFNVEEIEAADVPPPPKLKNGAPLVPTKDRKEAVAALDRVSRFLERAGCYEQFLRPLSAIREAIATTRGEASA
ncbi:hypothetical protein [Lacipirellula sp.]|uniref:hypothetical protein n=1 Tax=Lacipirellula sp. TaxID=2691419 RepID=UPI003D116635